MFWFGGNGRSSYVCFDCRKSFKLKYKRLCPDCRKELVFAGRDFKAPKRGKKKEWKIIREFLSSGRTFHCRAPVPKNLKGSKRLMSDVKRRADRFDGIFPISRTRLRRAIKPDKR